MRATYIPQCEKKLMSASVKASPASHAVRESCASTLSNATAILRLALARSASLNPERAVRHFSRCSYSGILATICSNRPSSIERASTPMKRCQPCMET
jgi:hypothetical protein